MVTSGLVVRSYSGYYYVDCAGVMITCKVKGHMKQKRFSLCTGDRVQLEVNPDKADEGMITAVLPRRNYLDRPTVANLDLLVITLALVQPDFSFLIADKLLVLAEAANIPVLLVLSKADLATEEQRERIAAVYRKIGYETFVISSKTGEGIDALRRRLEGKVTAFGGPSGVGKSSALNAIQPGVLRTTGEISTKISRGKHTTRYTELIPFNGGYLADTPGFGNVMMDNLEPDLLPACFPEFRQFETTCKFSPCSHTHEPVCGVKDAVQEKRIASSRYASYLSILEELIEKAGADWVHIDVMDGNFVPNLTFGAPVVKKIRNVTRMFYDCHLMVDHPETYIEDFAAAGADQIVVHAEATKHLHRCIQAIHAKGIKAGVALNPASSLALIEEILPDVDMVLLMTVNPGFGGQQFISAVLPKISRLRRMLDLAGLRTDIQVDGGINAETARQVVGAGATVLVAGSYVYGAKDVNAAVKSLRG